MDAVSETVDSDYKKEGAFDAVRAAYYSDIATTLEDTGGTTSFLQCIWKSMTVSCRENGFWSVWFEEGLISLL